MDIKKKALSYKTRMKKRFLRIATDQQSCAEVLGDINHGQTVYAFTGGQFGVINILSHLLKITGKADVKIMTWSAGDADLQYLSDMLKKSIIKSLQLLIDFSFPTRQPQYCKKILTLFPKTIKATNLHAKILIVSNENWHFTVLTSMNLNQNRRFENLEIVEGNEMTKFHLDIFQAIWKNSHFIDEKLNASEYKSTKNIMFEDEVEAADFDFDDLDFDFDFDFDDTSEIDF